MLGYLLIGYQWYDLIVECYGSSLSLCCSAPTGSGKTVIFELGIIRMFDQSKNTGKQAKCIYIAPTKVLSEIVPSFLPTENLSLGIMLRTVSRLGQQI